MVVLWTHYGRKFSDAPDMAITCFIVNFVFHFVGGTQLQGFTSVGRQTSATCRDLVTSHGTELHVTIVTRNAAELESVIYSDAVLVDLTPPDLCCAKVTAKYDRY